MTREEEILQVANENYSGYSERRLGFIAGAEWADKTMLDRACEWLAEHISPEEIYEDETDETPTTYLTVNIHTTMYDFINDFRKAMEGGAE